MFVEMLTDNTHWAYDIDYHDAEGECLIFITILNILNIKENIGGYGRNCRDIIS